MEITYLKVLLYISFVALQLVLKPSQSYFCKTFKFKDFPLKLTFLIED